MSALKNPVRRSERLAIKRELEQPSIYDDDVWKKYEAERYEFDVALIDACKNDIPWVEFAQNFVYPKKKKDRKYELLKWTYRGLDTLKDAYKHMKMSPPTYYKGCVGSRKERQEYEKERQLFYDLVEEKDWTLWGYDRFCEKFGDDFPYLKPDLPFFKEYFNRRRWKNSSGFFCGYADNGDDNEDIDRSINMYGLDPQELTSEEDE